MALDIARMAGMQPGDASGWMGGNAQASIPTTDLSPQLDGGQSTVNMGRNTSAPTDSQATMRLAAAVVLSALAVLWLSGVFVFRSARL